MSESPKNAILQRDNTYAIIPKTGFAGLLNGDSLRKLADVVDKYQIPVIKMTASQRIALVGIKEEDVNKVWADLENGSCTCHGLCGRRCATRPVDTV